MTRKTLLRAGAWGAALAVLGAVFMAYLSPQAMVDLATGLWTCF